MAMAISPDIKGSSTARLEIGCLFVSTIRGASRLCIYSQVADSDNDPCAIILIPTDRAMNENLVFPDPIAVVSYGHDWSINATNVLSAFEFSQQEIDLLPGSLLLADEGPTGIVLRTSSAVTVYYHFAAKKVSRKRPDFRASLARWQITVPSNIALNGLFDIETYRPAPQPGLAGT